MNGTKDELVPKEMVAQLAAAAKTTVTRYSVEGAHHTEILKQGRPQGVDVLCVYYKAASAGPDRRIRGA